VKLKINYEKGERIMSETVHVVLGSRSDWEKSNVFLQVLKELEIPYVVSIASCHWGAGNEFTDFSRRREFSFTVLIGGMAFAAPGIFSANLRNSEKSYHTVIGIPLDEAARRAIEDLPSGTPVLTCGLNSTDVKASIINTALAIAGVLSNDDRELGGRLRQWYLEKRREKYIVLNVELDDNGLIPDPNPGKKEV
jgi:phosphoribosylcarboxyaminoimidazole (NCAIR) mutase